MPRIHEIGILMRLQNETMGRKTQKSTPEVLDLLHIEELTSDHESMFPVMKSYPRKLECLEAERY